MLAVLVGLAGALVYGAADFVGGLASRRISAVRVTALGGLSGVLAVAIALPVLGGAWSVEAVGLGALAGLAGSVAIALLYGCLALGPMSILSPLTAVVSAIVPLTAGLLRGERFPPIGYLALGLALVAVVLVGFVPDRRAVRPSLRALLMAVGSGTLIGVFLIVIDLTPDDSGLVPVAAGLTVKTLLLFAVVGLLAVVARARGVSPTPGRWRPGLSLAIGSGVLDAAANVILLLGLRLGDLSVQSVLTALYPAGTIILAAVVLKERVTTTQYLGLGLALTAAALLALA
ncbi:MAG: hypothetical protein RI885_2452 [Actinomycetota bacterium]